MKLNDELFDKKVKEKLKLENNVLPDYANNAFKNGISKGLNNKRKKSKNIAGMASACIAVTIIFGVTLPTYAGDLPILRNIVDYFTDSRYKNYDKYASDLNISKESNGVSITINKVIYDGLDLEVFYTVETEKLGGKIPSLIDVNTKINGKEISFGSSSNGELLENISVGNLSYGLSERSMVPKELQSESFYGGYVDIPDEFLFSMEIDSILIGDSIVKGSWNFDIQVTNELVKGEVDEYKLNETISNISKSANINKLLTTPINTSIQGAYLGEEGIEFEFLVFDDKGRYISAKGGNEFGSRVNNEEYINYFNKQFQEVYEDTESLTFIPYKYRSNYEGVKTATFETKENEDGKEVIIRSNSIKKGNESFKLNADLNLNGETQLKTIMEDEYGYITKVQVGDGKTKLYIKSGYNILAAPIAIRDKESGREIVAVDNFDNMEIKTSKYLPETGEVLVEYDGELEGDNYEIIYYDYTNTISIYNENKFNVDLR
ncbi:MAG: DUF4179 domain-containing protein [Clostridium sp.]|uniref:DUF4179 domain-containing protein n=1 Tax=Clostridium sp. TaxID=1506 RepID=UPI0025B8D142|nr:DUF4179 domain-containing protein [Clostridium sp.]MBS4958546.1 DUF4179 domain-containing protein [Clostridium sp.]